MPPLWPSRRTLHFCGIDCTLSYLEELKTEQEAEAKEFAKELKELEVNGK